MTTAGCAGAQQALSVGSFVPSRSGRVPTPPALLWLVFALVDMWRQLAAAIIRTSVTRQRIRTGVVAARLPPIITTLAEPTREAAAEPVKALVNALHAVWRAAANPTLCPVVRMTAAFPGTLPARWTPQPKSKAHHGHRSGPRPSNGPRMARGAGSGPQPDQNRCPRREVPNRRSTKPLDSEVAPQPAINLFFRAK